MQQNAVRILVGSGRRLNTVRISVVVPTRNREKDVAACVRSILANDASFEVLVVDQSDHDTTERTLTPLLADGRLRYMRSDTRGVSRSRNAGIEATSGPVVAFTDDDCIVDKDWVARMGEVFDRDPDVALVFGRVAIPPEVDGVTKYAAMFEPEIREYQHVFPAVGSPWGIGANMAIRRATYERLGGFDPFLGPGAMFPAAEEYDLAIRVLAAGLKMVNASEASVLHLGVREGHVASALIYGYAIAIGAALAKHARLGTKDASRLWAHWLRHHTQNVFLNVMTGRRPTNARFVAGLLQGMGKACVQPLDPQRAVYRGRV